MALASVSVVFTVFVLKLHHCTPHQPRVPKWVRTWVTGYLAKIVFFKCFNSNKHKQNSGSLTDIPGDYKRNDEPEIMSKLMNDFSTSESTPKRCNHEKFSSGEIGSVMSDMRGTYHSNLSSLPDDNCNSDTGVVSHDRNRSVMNEVLRYLQCLLAKNDQQSMESDILDEWKQVAVVIDRTLLWLFLLTTLLSTFFILIVIPLSAYDMSGGI